MFPYCLLLYMQRVLIIYCFIIYYAKIPYYLLLYMQKWARGFGGRTGFAQSGAYG